MSPVTQYIFDGKKWTNEVHSSRATVSAATVTDPTYPYGAPGSYRPDADTTGPFSPITGITSTTAMTTINGDFTASANTLYDKIIFNGRVNVNVAGATFKRCIFRGKAAGSTSVGGLVNCSGSGVKNLVIEDSLFAPAYPSGYQDGIDGHDFTVRRCQVQDVVDYFGPRNTSVAHPVSGTPLNVVIEQNWAHSMSYWSPDPQKHNDGQSHNDGIQIQGGTGCVIRGNSIESYYGTAGTAQPGNAGSPVTPSTAGTNSSPRATWPSLSCMLFNHDTGTSVGTLGATGGHTVTDNWFMGAYYSVNTGGAGAVGLGTIHRNRFSKDQAVLSNGTRATIVLSAGQLAAGTDCGTGTADANVFDADLSEVKITGGK